MMMVMMVMMVIYDDHDDDHDNDSETLPLHLGFQVENLTERRSSDDDFRVKVARFQLHQFGEIGGRTDQNATHAHNLKR